MPTTEDARNKANELEGEAKEAAGKATGNSDLEDQGRAEKAKANLKQAFEKIKAVFQK